MEHVYIEGGKSRVIGPVTTEVIGTRGCTDALILFYFVDKNTDALIK